MRVFPCQGSHTSHVDKHISETCNVTTAQLPAKKCILQKQQFMLRGLSIIIIMLLSVIR